MKSPCLFVVLVMAMFFGLHSVHAHPLPDKPVIPPDFELASQWGGELTAVVAQGNYGYLGEGPRLKVLDLTPDEQGQSAMRIIGESERLPELVSDVLVGGSLVYVMAGGLTIFDVSQASQPQVVTTYDEIRGPNGMLLDGERLYVAVGDCDWDAYDVSDPGHIVEIASYHACGIKLFAGQFAYAIDSEHPLHIFELDESTSTATLVGTYAFSDPALAQVAWSLIQSEHDLVVLAGNEMCSTRSACATLAMLDISSPSAPRLHETIGLAGWAVDMEIVRGRVFTVLAEEGGGHFYLHDVSNPDELGLELMAYRPDLEFSRQIQIEEDRIYVFRKSFSSDHHIRDIRAYQISGGGAEAELVPAGSYRDHGNVFDIRLQDDTVYAVTDQGLAILDADSPTSLRKIGEIPTGPTTRRIQIFGDRVGIVDGWRREYTWYDEAYSAGIYDITAPDSPVWLGGDWISDCPSSLCDAPHLSLHEERLFVFHNRWLDENIPPHYGKWIWELTLFDIRNGDSWMQLGDRQQFPTETEFLHTEYDYVLFEQDDLKILDMAEPMTPTLAATLPITGELRQVVADDSAAAIWTQISTSFPNQYQLQIVDITDRSQPTEQAVYTVESQTAVEVIDIEGARLFVTSYDRYDEYEMHPDGSLTSISSQPIVPAPPIPASRLSPTSDLFYAHAHEHGLWLLRSAPRFWMPLVLQQ